MMKCCGTCKWFHAWVWVKRQGRVKWEGACIWPDKLRKAPFWLKYSREVMKSEGFDCPTYEAKP